MRLQRKREVGFFFKSHNVRSHMRAYRKELSFHFNEYDKGYSRRYCGH